MIFRYKGLERGDVVSFRNVKKKGSPNISGVGIVEGFGSGKYEGQVWVNVEGKNELIPFEALKKV